MDPATRQRTIKFGPYVVDLHAGELRKFGVRVRIQEKPLQMLAALAERSGQVVTREELRQRLWPGDIFVDAETGLNTAVSKLRDALSDNAEKPRYIETVPRRGYRFLFPVESGNGSSNPLDPETIPPGTTPSPAPGADRAPSPPVEIREARGEKSSLRVGLWVSAAAAAAIVAGAAYWLIQGRPAFSFRSRDSVLVADFENSTGDPRFDHALGTAFEVGIEQSRYVNVFPRIRLDSVLTRMERPLNEQITPALGREICQREGVRALIACSITRAGQEYALSAQLIDPESGETVRSYAERSSGQDHILEALDVLSREIRGALGESRYQIHQAGKPLPEVTTRSLSALQEYADGSILWRQGKHKDAVALFKTAVGDDPDFAMAHAALGRAYYSYIYNQQDEGEMEYKKALAVSWRTTDRERMTIETHYALDRNHATEADLLYRAYLSRYPDDGVARFDYATLLRQHDRPPDAIEQYNQTLRVMPDFARAYIGIATTYKMLGSYPQALQAYSKAFELDRHWLTTGDVNREYGFTLVANREDEKAAQVFSALLANPETQEIGLRSLAFLDLYHGRYASAQGRFEQALEILRENNYPLSMARVYLCLAIVAEGKGDAKEERKNLDAAFSYLKDIPPKAVFGAMLGDAYARAGLVDKAGTIAAIITPVVDRNSVEQMGYLHLLEGDIALAVGQRDRAIELLKQSDNENSTGFSNEALAHAYQQSGDIDQAVAAYEKMLSSMGRSLGWEPQQRWLRARYTLALDYSSRGDKQRARETLAALLSVWKAGDPSLPLLKQVKDEYSKL